MKEPMNKYFIPGIVHFMAFPAVQKGEGPIIETVKKIAYDSYFEAIEVTWIKDPAVRREVKRIDRNQPLNRKVRQSAEAAYDGYEYQ